jgi:hypothetical protein
MATAVVAVDVLFAVRTKGARLRALLSMMRPTMQKK